MGLCFYVSGDIETCSLLQRQPSNCSDLSSKKKEQNLVKREWSGENSHTDEKLWPVLRELKSAGDGPSAKCHNATVTSIPSGQKLTGNSAAKSSLISWVSNPANHINASCRLKKDIGNSLSTPGATTRESSLSSTYGSAPMTSILPHLYLGSYDDALNVRELQANGITHILSLIGNKSPVDFVQHENFPMHDLGRTDLKGVLSKVSKFVKLGQEDGNSVLVHCQWGQNRSAAVVIALMMKDQKQTLYCAHKKVKSLRPVVQINRRYAKQLLALERELFGKNSLPCEWMERGEFDLSSGEVTYKYEHVNSAEHRAMFDS